MLIKSYSKKDTNHLNIWHCYSQIVISKSEKRSKISALWVSEWNILSPSEEYCTCFQIISIHMKMVFDKTSHFRLKIGFICLFVCMFGVYCPTREFFAHMETSTLPVRGCKFWPILGTQDHWVRRVLKCATHTVIRIILLKWSSPRTRDTHIYCRAFNSGAVTTYFFDLVLSRLGFQPSFCGANALTHCTTAAVVFTSFWPKTMTAQCICPSPGSGIL